LSLNNKYNVSSWPVCSYQSISLLLGHPIKCINRNCYWKYRMLRTSDLIPAFWALQMVKMVVAATISLLSSLISLTVAFSLQNKKRISSQFSD